MYNIYEAMDLLEVRGDQNATTPEERAQHQRLINMLRANDHAKFADRLSLYELNIVEIDPKLGGDPNFTAAISPKRPIIYLSRGFLLDDDLFFQLNMLMRHELSHNLMMHEMRMLRKLGKENYDLLAKSSSFHNALNVIMDDEISNQVYSDLDKSLCRNLILNGKSIIGLVTEDHRDKWTSFSLEKMYDRFSKELEIIRQDLLNHRAQGPRKIKILTRHGYEEVADPVDNAIYSVLSYTDETTPANLFGTKPGKELQKSYNYKLMKADRAYKDTVALIDSMVNLFEKEKFSEVVLKKALHKICISDIYSPIILANVRLNTPEQKAIGGIIIKYYIGLIVEKPVVKVEQIYHTKEYLSNYNETLEKNYKDKSLSIKDLNEILGELSQKGVIANKTSFGSISKDQKIKLAGD